MAAMACPGSAQECHAVRGIVARELDSAVIAFRGGPAPLYGVGDCARKDLGHGPPQIRPRGIRIPEVCIAASDEEFKSRFTAVNPVLAGFDFAKHNLVLAGGAAAAILSHADEKDIRYSLGDYDFFFGGGATTEEDAARAATALGDHFVAKSLECLVYRSAACVTFSVVWGAFRFQVQIILRGHKSIAEILSGFDLGSCQVAWDGQHVHLTGLGKFAMGYRMNILCLETRRASLEERINKYIRRGYGLVMPELGSAAIPSAGKMGLSNIEHSGCLCGLTADPCYLSDERTEEPVLYSAINYDRGAKSLRSESIKRIDGGITSGLVAGAPYTTGLDVRTISLCLPKDEFDRLMDTAIGFKKQDGYKMYAVVPRLLAWLVGPAAARQLIEEAFTGVVARKSIDRAATERNKQLAAALPFRVEDSNSGRGRHTSAAEWYGSAWIHAE